RVSGTPGQESSLAAQEEELRASSTGEVVGVFRDRASGLREHRPGLDRVLAMAHAGQISVVRVTHEDRLARFGSAWLRQLLEQDGVLLEVAHPKGSAGGQQELLEDFTTLVATFCWRSRIVQ
ncbi:MAG: recombinase family protein, partial [Candidatus Dormibacteria bacterium]